jgi:hypothetical protein
MENNLIYALYCPKTNIPVYIGQTKNGLNRPFSHIKDQSHSIKVNEWVSILEEEGLKPMIVILEHSFNEEFLNDKESYWVNKFISQGHLLFNLKLIKPLHFINKEFDGEESSDPLQDIRIYIKAKRKMLKLTQHEVAERSGVGLRFYRELEQGHKTNFNTDSIVKVLSLLGNGKLSISK